MKDPIPLPLLQEIYSGDTWKQLICCILLNRTNRSQVDKIRKEFFERYPTPRYVVWPHAFKTQYDFDDLIELLRPLGFGLRRSLTIIGFSYSWETLPHSTWEEISKFPGMGTYAGESYRIFTLGDTNFIPTDKKLLAYLRKIGSNK